MTPEKINEIIKQAENLIEITDEMSENLKKEFDKNSLAATAAQIGVFLVLTKFEDKEIKPIIACSLGAKTALKPEWKKYVEDMKSDPDAECEVQNNIPEVEK